MNVLKNIGLIDQIYKNSDDSAVYIRNAFKAYGRGKNAKQILKGLNMTVERGCIYGLLGASGCGKTTLLNCIVGRNLLNAGELWVLGGTPGTEGSGVPGPRVGYMPQETALVQELTVLETIKFFGRICAMDEDKILVRFKELSKLLDLPPSNQLVGTLSGGQQRRVSFAAALVHEPELLILDEPTVGLDPLLRHKIWEHLLQVTSNHKTTVIITTHYIEECRQAHKIGLMRQGKLLADGNPEDIIAQYGTDNLEDVFLKLSKEQNETNDNVIPSTTQSTENIISPSNGNSTCSLEGIEILDKIQEQKLKDHKKHKKRTRKAKLFRAFTVEHERVKSLFFKNLIQICRNKLGLGMIFLFPIFQTSLFFISIGGEPKDLPIAIVNGEDINCLNKNYTSYLVPSNESDCDFRFLSCKFIDELDDPMIKKVYYEDIESAIYSVQKGKTHGVIYFPGEYTNFIKNLVFGNLMKAENGTFDLGKLKVWLDMSNLQFGPRIKLKLLDKFVELQKSLLETCNYNPEAGSSLVKMNEPIYGTVNEGGYLVFCLPGTLVTLCFFLMTIATSSIIVEERTEGVWDRILVAGATTAEVLLNHLLTQLVIAMITTTEVLVLTFYIFKFSYAGNIFNLAGLLLAQCFCGVSFGFMISSVAKNFTAINSLSGGIFLPMTLVSGVMWPLEAMPEAVKTIAFGLPFAFSVEAFRSVLMKGWVFTNPAVYLGYLMPFVWSFIYILLTFYLLKRKM